jgi:hypothetical protein
MAANTTDIPNTESANPLHTKSIVKKNKSIELRMKTSRNN